MLAQRMSIVVEPTREPVPPSSSAVTVTVCVPHRGGASWPAPPSGGNGKNWLKVPVSPSTSALPTLTVSRATSTKPSLFALTVPLTVYPAVSYTHLRAHETRHDLV